MESYSINDAERLTGIKAHTLRIWEKRYKTLIPHRTTTQIRYYDDDQMRRLLNVATLLQCGHKISKVMDYTEEQVQSILMETVNAGKFDDHYVIYINNLVNAMMNFDEPMMDKIFSNIFIRFGIKSSMINIIYPFLDLTGVLWSVANIIPAQEHFASNIIKRKLMTAIDGIPVNRNSGKKYLLFLPPGEWHELGLLLGDYLIRSAGFETIYLGQNVPFNNVITGVERTKPDYMLTFFVAGADFSEALSNLKDIAIKFPKSKILVATNNRIDVNAPAPNITILNEPIKIFDYL